MKIRLKNGLVENINNMEEGLNHEFLKNIKEFIFSGQESEKVEVLKDKSFKFKYSTFQENNYKFWDYGIYSIYKDHEDHEGNSILNIVRLKDYDIESLELYNKISSIIKDHKKEVFEDIKGFWEDIDILEDAIYYIDGIGNKFDLDNRHKTLYENESYVLSRNFHTYDNDYDNDEYVINVLFKSREEGQYNYIEIIKEEYIQDKYLDMMKNCKRSNLLEDVKGIDYSKLIKTYMYEYFNKLFLNENTCLNDVNFELYINSDFKYFADKITDKEESNYVYFDTLFGKIKYGKMFDGNGELPEFDLDGIYLTIREKVVTWEQNRETNTRRYYDISLYYGKIEMHEGENPFEKES